VVRLLKARRIFDSRGVPTIEIEVTAGDGWGRSSGPFGALGSRGEFEASAYGSIGLDGAVGIVTDELARRLVGMDATDLVACDAAIRAVDGTPNFDRIGGNTSSTLSIAIARAAADSLGVPLHRFLTPGEAQITLPLPLGNIIGGGAHATGPTPDMQEHLVMPVSARTFREAVELNIAVHQEAGRILAAKDRNFVGGTDDEHAWAANLDDFQALEVLAEACEHVSADTGARFRLGLDVAADRLWDREAGVYRYCREGQQRTTAEQIDFLESLTRIFNLGYVEDGFESTDYDAFAELRRRVGDTCLVCGDDLLATNRARTERGVALGSVSAMIIKVNQVGTLTDARAANDYARSQGIKTAISHRSGETEDPSIAHVGVAFGCSLMKAGVLGGERLAKLNELIRIEEAAAGSSRLGVDAATLIG
jgi:enolase